VGVLNLGYPLWLLAAVLVLLGALTFYVLRGRVSDRLLLPLTIALTPVSAVLVVAVAVLISSLLSPFYEAPSNGLREKPQETPTPTPEPTAPTTTPSATPSVSPSASPSASASATATATATASASASP